MRIAILACLALAAFGCAARARSGDAPHPRSEPPPAAAPTAVASATATSAPGSEPSIVFVTDLASATETAKREHKLLFVDAWAPWCHTCLSMRNYVLTDATLRPFAQRIVFVAMDTDRPESAPFLDHHAMSVWPTFFLLDPSSDAVLGSWPGSASASELRAFLDEGLRAADAHVAGRGDATLALLVAARAAQARRDYAGAAARYEQVVERTDAGARRSEALVGWIEALYASKQWPTCARVGEAHVRDVEGAGMPGDFASFILACAEHLDAAAADKPRRAAIARLAELAASPPSEASADDRADALLTLAEGRDSLHDAAGARAAREQALAVLERAAADAPTPEVAATHDYARAKVYVALGRAEEAVLLLTSRERQLPDSYEPSARLAGVLERIGRHREALAAIDRAIGRAYGPRRLQYLKLRAEIQTHLGDRTAQIATLKEEVAGYEGLPPGQASAERLADARRRLEAALASSSRKP